MNGDSNENNFHDRLLRNLFWRGADISFGQRQPAATDEQQAAAEYLCGGRIHESHAMTDTQKLAKLLDAVDWVLNDGQYKAPEQFNADMTVWFNRLMRARAEIAT